LDNNRNQHYRGLASAFGPVFLSAPETLGSPAGPIAEKPERFSGKTEIQHHSGTGDGAKL
jgi:hypothetical protein